MTYRELKELLAQMSEEDLDRCIMALESGVVDPLKIEVCNGLNDDIIPTEIEIEAKDRLVPYLKLSWVEWTNFYTAQSPVQVGDFFEDCYYHPVLCTETDGSTVGGISIIDGSYPRLCKIGYCAVRKLTAEEALEIKHNGPSDEKKQHIEALNKSDQGWQFDEWWKK